MASSLINLSESIIPLVTIGPLLKYEDPIYSLWYLFGLTLVGEGLFIWLYIMHRKKKIE